MKSKHMTLIGILVILIAGGFYIYKGISGLSQDISPADPIREYEKQKLQASNPVESEVIKASTPIKYVPFDETTQLVGQSEKLVLFFYASWCPTCRPVDTELRQDTSKLPDGVKVVRVNYKDPDTEESEKELAKKYGITYQHTFVQIDSVGKEIKKWNGGGIDQILRNMK